MSNKKTNILLFVADYLGWKDAGVYGMLVFLFLLRGIPCLNAAEKTIADDAGLNAAVASAAPGDLLLVKPGSYRALKCDRSGTPGKRIIIRNAGGSQGEVRIKRLEITGAYITVDGIRVTGDGKYTPCSVQGHHNRLTNCTLDAVVSGTWFSLGGYEQEIDHCAFVNKDNNKGGGQLIRHFPPTGDKRPEGMGTASTILHHNRFLNVIKGPKRNGYETIQLFGVDHELDTVLARNYFSGCNGEPEMVSIKADGCSFLHNTLHNNRGRFVGRVANRCFFEGNFFFGGSEGGIRLQGLEYLVRNNYFAKGSNVLLGATDGKARLSRFCNNTFIRTGGFANAYRENRGHIYANNLMLGSSMIGGAPLEHGSWTVTGNMVQDGSIGPKWMPGTVADLKLVARQQWNSKAPVMQPGKGSPAIGKSVPNKWMGGLDPYGNPLSRTPDVGAIQATGKYNILGPLTEKDVGPWTQKGATPTVRITSPKQGGKFNGPVKVAVDADDADGTIAYVYLHINNFGVSVDTEAPYEWTITPEQLPAPLNRFRAIAYDNDGNIAMDTVWQTRSNCPEEQELKAILKKYPDCKYKHIKGARKHVLFADPANDEKLPAHASEAYRAESFERWHKHTTAVVAQIQKQGLKGKRIVVFRVEKMSVPSVTFQETADVIREHAGAGALGVKSGHFKPDGGVQKWAREVTAKWHGKSCLEICNRVSGALAGSESELAEMVSRAEVLTKERTLDSDELKGKEIDFSTVFIGVGSVVSEEFVTYLNSLPRYKALIANKGDFPLWDKLKHAVVIPTAWRGMYKKSGYKIYFDEPEDERYKDKGLSVKNWYDANKDRYPVMAIAINPRGMAFGGRKYSAELWKRNKAMLATLTTYLKDDGCVFMTPKQYAEAYRKAEASMK